MRAIASDYVISLMQWQVLYGKSQLHFVHQALHHYYYVRHEKSGFRLAMQRVWWATPSFFSILVRATRFSKHALSKHLDQAISGDWAHGVHRAWCLELVLALGLACSDSGGVALRLAVGDRPKIMVFFSLCTNNSAKSHMPLE